MAAGGGSRGMTAGSRSRGGGSRSGLCEASVGSSPIGLDGRPERRGTAGRTAFDKSGDTFQASQRAGGISVKINSIQGNPSASSGSDSDGGITGYLQRRSYDCAAASAIT